MKISNAPSQRDYGPIEKVLLELYSRLRCLCAGSRGSGADAVHDRVGVEPTGDSFNSTIDAATGRPFNPMVECRRHCHDQPG